MLWMTILLLVLACMTVQQTEQTINDTKQKAVQLAQNACKTVCEFVRQKQNIRTMCTMQVCITVLTAVLNTLRDRTVRGRVHMPVWDITGIKKCWVMRTMTVRTPVPE